MGGDRSGKPPGRGTRERLIAVALEMLAEQGVQGVSLNQIVRRAGARNPSAIRYHFGGREELLRAVLQHIAGLLQPLQKDMLGELETTGRERPLTARDYIAAVHLPVLMLYFSDREGMHAARLLSRCTWEFGDTGQRMLVEIIGPTLNEVWEQLLPLLPDPDVDALSIRFLLSLSSLFHAVTDMDVIAHLPLATRTEPRLLLADPGKLIERYLDFQCYGVLGRPSP